MKTAIDFFSIASCALIAFQDFKDRMISVYLLVLLGLSLAGGFLIFNMNETNLFLVLSNILFLTGQFLLLYIYFKHIRKYQRSFFDEIIGWGDVIMLMCMAIAFPLPQLVLCLFLSSVSGLVFIALGTKKTKTITVPLAGIMGIFYITNLVLFYLTGIYPLHLFES